MLPSRYSTAESCQERKEETPSDQMDKEAQRANQILDGGRALESRVDRCLLEDAMGWWAFQQNVFIAGCGP
ncbi:MAG: hypothetical protein OXC92_10585 [Flavobacteriaceae bacterium]|nr:hypothetical protein [Flavobacteriaceae bacterium]